MVCKLRRCQKGFTLLEMLIAFAIMGILWGIGISVAPRLLSGSGADSLARLLAGAGQEAKQMALLQQRPWELLIDLDRGVFYRAPLGAVIKRELRASGELGDGSLDPANRGGSAFSSLSARRGEIRGQDLIALRQQELNQQSSGALGATHRDDRPAFDDDDTDSDIFESIIPEEVTIVQIWKRGGLVETTGRVSLVFGPRGFIQPTAVWLEDANFPGRDRYTVYFSGILPPVVVGGTFLPDAGGVLTPVDLQ
jgi:prepilin-type N-terminal cleavage/methylation domain-containing protein